MMGGDHIEILDRPEIIIPAIAIDVAFTRAFIREEVYKKDENRIGNYNEGTAGYETIPD